MNEWRAKITHLGWQVPRGKGKKGSRKLRQPFYFFAIQFLPFDFCHQMSRHGILFSWVQKCSSPLAQNCSRPIGEKNEKCPTGAKNEKCPTGA